MPRMEDGTREMEERQKILQSVFLSSPFLGEKGKLCPAWRDGGGDPVLDGTGASPSNRTTSQGGVSMNIIDLASRNGRLYPDDPAFVEIKPVSKQKKVISWKEFDERTNSLANGLIERGVRKGDRVFMMSKNSISWLEAYFGIIKTGAWVNPLNFRFTDENIAYCAAAAEPCCFIFEEEYASLIQKSQSAMPSIKKLITIGS